MSPVREATALGAAFLAGLAVGTWKSDDEARGHVGAPEPVEPRADRALDRAVAGACRRAERWIPDLSAGRLLTGQGQDCSHGTG